MTEFSITITLEDEDYCTRPGVPQCPLLNYQECACMFPISRGGGSFEFRRLKMVGPPCEYRVPRPVFCPLVRKEPQ